MRIKALFVAAVVAAGAAGPAPAVAATVSQSVAFTHDNDYLDVDQYGVRQTRSQLLHFNGFDPSLGTLTGAQWRLSSTQAFDTFFVIGAASDLFMLSLAEGFIRYDGQELARSELHDSDSGPGFCGGAGPICAMSFALDQDFGFDLAAPSLAPFLAPGGLDVTLGSEIRHFAMATVVRYIGSDISADFDWNGSLSLTYTYEPAAPPPPGVPEPATWIAMLLGFGAAGAALRSRRRAASA